MILNAANLMHSLCLWLETATSLKYATTPRAIWRGQAAEGASCADTYSVVRLYGGAELVHDPVEVLAVQVMTVGTTVEGAMSQARKLFEAVLNADGTPKIGWTIAGKTTAGVADGTWRIISIAAMQRPTVIGVDERGRSEVSFNWELCVSR
jgi:hypothetical protein